MISPVLTCGAHSRIAVFLIYPRRFAVSTFQNPAFHGAKCKPDVVNAYLISKYLDCIINILFCSFSGQISKEVR